MTWEDLVNNTSLRENIFLWQTKGQETLFVLTRITLEDNVISIQGRRLSQAILGYHGTSKFLLELPVDSNINPPREEDGKIIVSIPRVGRAIFFPKTI